MDKAANHRERRPVPRRRIEISETDTGFPERFALHLRALLERRGWGARHVSGLLQAAGLDIKDRAIDAWLRAESMPRARDLEAIANALGLEDYRELLPPPIKKR